MWRLTRICERSGATAAPARSWTCQVKGVGPDRDALLIDLVPLEPGSISPMAPTMLPFTLRISRDLGTSVVASWAAHADVIGVEACHRGPIDRLMLSAGEHQLVFEVPADRPCDR